MIARNILLLRKLKLKLTDLINTKKMLALSRDVSLFIYNQVATDIITGYDTLLLPKSL